VILKFHEETTSLILTGNLHIINMFFRALAVEKHRDVNMYS
jgi:hypothetical protein